MQETYSYVLGSKTFNFKSLADLMAKATPKRSGDELAGVAADSSQKRVVAQMKLCEIPLKTFLTQHLISYEEDEVTRLIIDEHDAQSFETISHLSVGDFRNWLLSDEATPEVLKNLQAGLTPEMVAAVSKIMRNQTNLPNDGKLV